MGKENLPSNVACLYHDKEMKSSRAAAQMLLCFEACFPTLSYWCLSFFYLWPEKKDSNRHHNLYPLYFAFIPCSLLGSIQDHVQLLRRAWDISSNHIKRSHKRPLTAVAKLQNVLRYTHSSSEFMTLGTKKGTEIVSYNRDNDTSQQETCILKNEISIIVGATCMNRRHILEGFSTWETGFYSQGHLE